MAPSDTTSPASAPQLTLVAQFDHQVTGVAVVEDGRRFVNFPRWTDDAPVSVAEVTADGALRPHPDARWNSWRNAKAGEMEVGEHFVCVQSIVADGQAIYGCSTPAHRATRNPGERPQAREDRIDAKNAQDRADAVSSTTL